VVQFHGISTILVALVLGMIFQMGSNNIRYGIHIFNVVNLVPAAAGKQVV
jgi:hypothetical protein